LVKSRARVIRLRAGDDHGDPIYDVGPDAWVPYEKLPHNLMPEPGDLPVSDAELMFRMVDNLDGYEVPESAQERLARLRPPVVEVAVEVEPEPEPQRATLAMTVDEDKLAEVMGKPEPEAEPEAGEEMVPAPKPPKQEQRKGKRGRR